MARGRGRGSAGRVGKSSGRGNSAIPPKMPTVPIPTTVSPQQGGTSSNIGGLDRTNQVQILGPSSTPPVQMPNHNNIPTDVESSPITPNESNQIGEGASTQSSTIGEGESNNRGQRRTVITLTPTGLVHVYSIISIYIFNKIHMYLNNVLTFIDWSLLRHALLS